MKRFLIGAIMVLLVGVLFGFFTPPGRRLVVCPVYDSMRMKLLKRPGMQRHLSQRWEAWNRTPVQGRQNWFALKLAGGIVPVPPVPWDISPASPEQSFLTLVSNKNSDYHALILSLNERYPPVQHMPYRFFLDHLADPYEFYREVYSRDFSQPCDPHHSSRSLSRDFLLMILKAVSAPQVAERRFYHHTGSGYLAIVQRSQNGQAWLADVFFKSAGQSIHATYAMKKEAHITPLLEQLTLINQSDLNASILPPSLKSLPEKLLQLQQKEQGDSPL
jgi:hypothetical protein